MRGFARFGYVDITQIPSRIRFFTATENLEYIDDKTDDGISGKIPKCLFLADFPLSNVPNDDENSVNSLLHH